MDIERLATSAVEDAIAKTDFLSPYVNSGDREPCWDGYLYAYSHKSKKNEYYIGKAPVQVKGKKCEVFSSTSLKYSIKVTDLRNYCIEGGTIYFVIQIDKKGNKKIFYNSLLPYDINKMLERAEHKNTLSVKMSEFPADINEITNIIINFIHDKDKQVLLRNGKNISIEDALSRFGSENLTFGFSYTGLGHDREKPYEYLFSHDIYIYMENKELNLHIPIDHILRAESATTHFDASVYIDGREFYKEYDILHMTDRDEIHLGKSIVFKILHGGGSKVDFSIKGNLDERIVSIDFIIKLIQKGSVVFHKTKIEIHPTKEEAEAMHMDELIEHLEHLKLVKKVLDDLDVNIPLECDMLTPKDEQYIKMLLLGIKYKEKISFKEKSVPGIGYISIVNLNIMLYFKEQENGKYFIFNFADGPGTCKSDYSDGKCFDTSKYTILKEKDFRIISNLRYDKIEAEIMSIENSGHYIRTNQILLEMLKAYDINHDKELLRSATRIAEWLLEKDEDKDIAYINLFQCYIRDRKLEEVELEVLDEILQNRMDNTAVSLGVNILLQDDRKAKKILEQMSKEDRELFMEFPIYTLYNNGLS